MKKIYIEVQLTCPDNYIEILGFHIPKELDEFLNFINIFSKKGGYIIKLKKRYIMGLLAECKSWMKKKGR